MLQIRRIFIALYWLSNKVLLLSNNINWLYLLRLLRVVLAITPKGWLFLNSKPYITDHLNCLQLDGCDETTNINMRDAMLMRWSERESDVKLAYNNNRLRYDNYMNIKQTHKNINTHMAIILLKCLLKWMNYYRM